MSRLNLGQLTSRWHALIWVVVLFLLVRIATHGSFTWDHLIYAYELDAAQIAFVAVAGVMSIALAWRALRSTATGVDRWIVGGSVAFGMIGAALWSLGHDSASVIIGLAALGGLVALVRPRDIA